MTLHGFGKELKLTLLSLNQTANLGNGMTFSVQHGQLVIVAAKKWP
jgi:hypothetical protein